MNHEYYFKYIAENIHSTIVATVDSDGLPVTCAVDIMDYDEGGLYFLTAKGKNFYKRLVDKKYLAFTALKGESTMSSVAVSVRGRVKELGSELIPKLFEKNPYMNEIYPNEQAREALTVFKIYEGSGEWFDLSKKPIERDSFSFGDVMLSANGYFVTADCIGCLSCVTKCPQNCIDVTEIPVVINQKNCLHCGNCLEVCPAGAVVRK